MNYDVTECLLFEACVFCSNIYNSYNGVRSDTGNELSLLITEVICAHVLPSNKLHG